MTQNWPPERRAAQAERCRANRPWQKSTGPKTKAGKARAAMNAYKHGGDRRYQKLTSEILKHNRAFLNAYKEFASIELIKTFENQCRIGAPPLNSRKTN